MTDFNDETILLKLANRLETNPAFMAHVLARYCEIEGMDKNALAEELKIPSFLLARLALCKRPAADSLDFANEINEVADFVLADELKLTQIIREVDSLAALDQAIMDNETAEEFLNNPFSGAILAAARDHDEDEEADKIDEDEK